MADTLYDVSDLIGKTIYGSGPVDIYKSANDNAVPVQTIPKGQPIGELWSWLNPSSDWNRSNLWFMFWPDGQDSYYVKYGPNIDIPALVAQGVLTEKQKADAAALAAMPWYEQLIVKYGPYVLGAVVVAAVVKGYFSRPRSNN